MRPLQCTQFPDLSVHPASSHESGVPFFSQVLAIGGLHLPSEILHIAWAWLLQSLTGSSEVVYHTDSALVSVDATRWHINEYSHQTCSAYSIRFHTGLFLRTISTDRPLTFYLECDTASGIGYLSLPSHVTQERVHAIYAQLEKAIDWARDEARNRQVEMGIEKPTLRLSISNPKPVLQAGPQLLHDLLEGHRGSQELALDFLLSNGERVSLDYQALHARSDAWARALKAKLLAEQAPSNPTVPVLLPQSPELYVILLAILKAGANFCPLNLDAPIERMKFIFQDVNAQVVITTSQLAARIPALTGLDILLTDQDEADVENNAPFDGSFSVASSPNDLAYVMYTSGSTGTPKGVGVSHLAASQSLLAHNRHIPQFSRFLQFAAPTFDVSVFEIFFPLYRGRTLVGSDRATLINDLPEVMNSMKVDAVELTPTVAGGLLRSREAVPGLKLLLTIGEMLTPHVVNEFGSSDSHDSLLWGMYGPTECAIHCTIQTAFQASDNIGRIGLPLDTVSAFIISPASAEADVDNVEVLPVGQAGELAIGGYQLSTGYINRPDQTAAVFVDTKAFGRLYRTGDRARMQQDGSFECIGRISAGQVKLRGQRVELGEVEQVATKLAACRTAVALVIDNQLVLFCLVVDKSATIDDILRVCKQWLPSFMVPSDIFIMESFPQLPSGKTDRKMLERYCQSHRATLSGDDSADTDEITRLLRKTFENLTGRQISPQSNLTSSGLDSLLAIRAASMLRSHGYHIGPIEIIEAGTMRALQKALKSVNESSYRQEKSSHILETVLKDFKNAALDNPHLQERQDEIQDIFPATPLQASMLSEIALDPSSYCNCVELGLPQNCDLASVEAALDQLAATNDILRTGFCSVSNSLSSHAQIIWKKPARSWQKHVSILEPSYRLENEHALLRPVTVQIEVSDSTRRLLLLVPHPLYDGWTIDLLRKDLSDLLAFRDPPLRPQFSEVARYYMWAREGRRQEASRDYWRSRLDGYQPRSLPNFNGKVVQRPTIKTETHDISATLKDVRRRSHQLGISPQVLFQACVIYLAASYLGTDDIAIGTVTSGRTIPLAGIEDIYGPCIATLPLRLDLSQISMARDLLNIIHKLNRELIKYCTLPLNEIKRICEVAPGKRLFDIVFVWQESLLSSNESESLSVQQLSTTDRLEVPLLIEVEPDHGKIHVKATYNTSDIPSSQVSKMLLQIDYLVRELLSNVNMSLESFGETFDHSCLSIANPKPIYSECKQSLISSVERYAAKQPDRLALAFYSKSGDSFVTYSELNIKANQLAHLLVEEGVKPDDTVCICMEKSVYLYVSILAVLKTGAGYLPLTPDTPSSRINTILDEIGSPLCLSDRSSAKVLRSIPGLEVINVLESKLTKYPERDLNIPFCGSHLAYAVFTSGSTGKPKGVLVTQANLLSNLEVLSQMYPVSEESRLLQACSQAFDVSVFEIFFTWFTGMCLCAAIKDELFQNLEDIINHLRITHLSLTPTVAALINPLNVPDVEFLVTAGEGVTEHVKRQWSDRGLWQGYGPSETTNICTIQPNVTSADLINNIGRPFKNTSVFVLEPESTRIVPRGGVGELCFGGDQVFRGYLNRSDLNRVKIINHPEFGRLYRSGDLGQLLPDDSILFVGRADDQVKLRGQRIELGEINSCVLECADVEDCVTLLLTTEQQRNKTQRLGTFFVPKPSSPKQYTIIQADKYMRRIITNIFQNLSSKLPAYMLPTLLVPISSLPRTPQSKIDKRRLIVSFDGLSSEQLDAFTADHKQASEERPSSESEKKIAQALSDFVSVQLDDIGRHTSFFGLGIDSISAISLCRTMQELGLGQISVSTVLRNPSVAKLAAAIAQNNMSEVATPTQQARLSNIFSDSMQSSIRQQFKDIGRSIQSIRPCTPLQEAMLSAGRSGASTAYINRMVFQIQGDVGRVQTCWEVMSERHEILRTSFVATEHPQYAFAQVVLSPKELAWDTIKVADVNLQNTLEDLTQAVSLAEQDGLSPPLHFALIKTTFNVYMAFYCHHALYDGSAMSSLLQEIEATYNRIQLPAPIPYEPFLGQMISLDLHEADEFWKDHLQDFEPTSFPDLTERATSRDITSSCEVFSLELSMSLSRTYEACRNNSVSLLSTVQAAWCKLLAHYLGDDDICFGNVVSGRTLPIDGLERLIAPCFNTLPVRAKFSPGDQTKDLMLALQSTNADMMPFQLTPLRRIQSKCGEDGKKLFDTLFLLQQPAEELNAGIWRLIDDYGEMEFPLACEVVPQPQKDNIRLLLHYHSTVATAKEVEVIGQTYDYALTSCLMYPTSHARDIANIPIRLLSIRNPEPTTIAPIAGPLLHSGFEKNASENPDAIALEFLKENGEIEKWTFKTLNMQANRIAFELLKNKVEPDEAVPIHISKAPSFYASVLGVLKAGAAFTPIDPNLPDARKAFIIEELGARVVLCAKKGKESWSSRVTIIDPTKLSQNPSERPEVTVSESSLTYRLYTSGSTGKPKAVSVEHRNPVQTIESSRSIIPWTKETKLLQYAATTFDMCYYDCFLAWTFGFTLCAAEQAVMFNDLTLVIRRLETTMLDLTPSVAMNLSPIDVPSVEYLYCIGEAMPHSLVETWAGKCVNSYGPTEAAFCTSIFQVDKALKSTIFGKPFPTVSFTVLSKSGDVIVPVLGTGELYLGGPQVAREYHANRDLTHDRFITRGKTRMYKTGDLVRILANGTFEFIGRTDDQVKIRGLRVELDEITVLIRNAHPDISAATVQIMKLSEESKEQLVAFVQMPETTGDGRTLDVLARVKEKAKENLPTYMVPTFFLPVNEIPLSTAGKIDKKALEKIYQRSSEATSAPEGAESNSTWDPTELKIRDAMSRLSGTPVHSIGHNTTIYQLGLDSISAVQLASMLRKSGVDISASDVLSRPTSAELAMILQSSSRQKSPPVAAYDFTSFSQKHIADLVAENTLKATDVSFVRPCTPLQNGLLASFLRSDGLMYFNYIKLSVDPRMSVPLLEKAWHNMVDRHELLRSGFTNVNDASSTFANITYQTYALDDQLAIVRGPQWTRSEALQWHSRQAREVLTSLHKKAWSATIIESKEETTVHLSILHAIYDAQSLRIILQDLAADIERHVLDTPTPIDSVLSSIMQESKVNEASRSFWKKQSQSIAVNRFPNMCPLFEENTAYLVASHTSARGLRALELSCRDANITIQAAGQAAWTRILSAYIGEPTVTFGVVLSGRVLEHTEKAAFPCITTIPATFQNNDNNRDLLTSTMAYNAEVQSHQYTPLAEIQRLHDHTDEPLFDTLFAYQKLLSDGINSELFKVVDEEAAADYTISIELEPTRDGYLLYRITFAQNILPTEQAELLLKQLDALLTNIVENPDGHATQMPKSYAALYSITPPIEPEIPSEVSLLHQFVEISAEKFPTRVALEFATQISPQKSSTSWTYAELNAGANRVANLLAQKGVKSGELVAVCFDKCAEASVALIGILKAGCAYVALDPSAPVARKSYILEDSEARILFSMDTTCADIREQARIPIITFDKGISEDLPSTAPILEQPIAPQDRSYCLYTSGTTGTPKGCELTHENAVQAMMAFQRLFADNWDENSRWLQFASFHFDVSVLEQFWSWSRGIRVVSAPRDLIFENIASAIRELGITHIDLTPSLARLLHPDDVPSLWKGVFITGGESLRQDILDMWGTKGVIYNGYGPTEATIGVTMYPRVPKNGRPSNIGPQFDNVGSLILRPGTDIPVLRGAVGELCVSGKLVGKGYLKRPDLTAERFPYLEKHGVRIYRTGDLVRMLSNGCFDFLGRIDDQVKLRGQRLEIGEINSVIKQSFVDILDVATLVLKHPVQQSEQLVSFIVTTASLRKREKCRSWMDDLGIIALVKEICQSKLAGYMVPTHIIILTSIPLNANNKADAKQLKDLYNSLRTEDLQTLSGISNPVPGVWSRTEEALRDILKSMAQVDCNEIQRTSSIFELGLDSISVIALSKALRKQGFSNTQPSVIMKNPTLSALAKVIKPVGQQTQSSDRSVTMAKQLIRATQHRFHGVVARALNIPPDNIQNVAPCTALQQGIIARSLESKKPVYFNTFAYRLSDDVNIETLRASWQRAYDSVPILRTRFVSTVNGYVQAVLKSDLPWQQSSISADDDLKKAIQKYQKDCWASNGENFIKTVQMAVLQSPSASYFVAVLFHAVYDGNSLPMLMKHVYSAYSNHENINWGPSFFDILPYGPLRTMEGARQFWVTHFADTTSHKIKPLTSAPSEHDVFVTRTLNPISNYQAVRKKLNVTDQAIAQACWAVTVQNIQSAAVTLGIVSSGRSIDYEGADQVIGPVFNTVPFHLRRKPGDTWSSLVKRCHQFNAQALAYQHTPLRDIIKWCRPHGTEPFFEVLFVFQKAVAANAGDENELWRLIDDETFADYPLALEVLQQETGEFRITLAAQSGIANESLVNNILGDFERVFQSLLADPDDLVCDTLGATEYPPNDGSSFPSGVNDLEPVTAPSDALEWTLEAAAIREAIANLAGISSTELQLNTSILEVGLDSIDAIKLSSRLCQMDIRLPVSAIMQCLTISKMAEQANSSRTSDSMANDNISLETEERKLLEYLQKIDYNLEDVDSILPTTPLQEGMVAEMITSDFTRYFNHDILRLTPNIDIVALKDAWAEVVMKSPVLRTTFVEVDDPSIRAAYGQVIYRFKNLLWEEVVLVSAEEIYQIAESKRKLMAKNPEHVSLFHLTLAKADSAIFLVISISHALYDGWSLALLHQDVKDAYYGKLKPRPDYRPVLANILSGTGVDAEGFWVDFLAGVEPSTMPSRQTDKAPGVQIIHRQEIASATAEEEIREFCKKQAISLQALGQACWSLVLASYTRSLDVTFGVVLSGRDSDAANELLFPTMNTVAFRCVLHGTGQELLQYIQDSVTDIRKYHHYPLRNIQSVAGTSGMALFDTLFIYQRRPNATSTNQGSLYQSINGISDVEYPVCIEMEFSEDALIWRCACSDTVFNRNNSLQLLEQLDQVLTVLMTEPTSPILKFSDTGTEVCGLPAFQETENDGTLPVTEDNIDDENSGANWTEAEFIIRDTLASVADVPPNEVTKSMTIFHLGLDSISAIKVSSLLRKKSIQISVSEIVKAGSISKMSQAIKARETQPFGMVHSDAAQNVNSVLGSINIQEALDTHHIDAETVEDILPATSGQVYMLSIWQKSGGELFFPRFEYILPSQIDLEVLENAWKQLIKTTPILRTIFIRTNDDMTPFVQVVFKAMEEISSQPTMNAMADLKFEETTNGWLLKLKIHHALYDAVSLSSIMHKFERILSTIFENPSRLSSQPALAETFTNFVGSSLSSSVINDRKEFWTRYFHNAPTGLLLQPQRQSHSPRVDVFRPKTLAGDQNLQYLTELCKKHGLSLQALLLVAYGRAYARVSQSLTSSNTTQKIKEVIVGVYLANRSHDEHARISLLPTLNIVPLRINIKDSVLASARTVQEDLQEISSVTNSTVGLWEIHKWNRVRIDTCVNILRLPGGDSQDEGAELQAEGLEARQTIKVQALNEDLFEPRSTRTDPKVGEWEQQLLQKMGTGTTDDAYLHSVDIELAVRGNNLDVGVFGREDMISLERAEDLIDIFVRELNTVADGR